MSEPPSFEAIQQVHRYECSVTGHSWTHEYEMGGAGVPVMLLCSHCGESVPVAGVPLALYSEALDEIYRLRRALAYEARGVDAHRSMASFPASRRRIADDQIRRMRDAAKGNVGRAYAGEDHNALSESLRWAGASQNLTRHAWEEQIAQRTS